MDQAKHEYRRRAWAEIDRLSAMERPKLEAECRANHIPVTAGISDDLVRQLLLDRFHRLDKFNR